MGHIRIFIAIFILSATSLPASAFDEKKLTGARLFAGIQHFPFDQANALIDANGIDPINSTIFGGVELDRDIWGPLILGFRYQAHFATEFETADPPVNATDRSYASLNRHVFAAVARLKIVRAQAAVLEVFGGAGGAASKLKIHASGVSQSFERNSENLSGVTMAGVTVGFGWGGLYLFGEVGEEWSKTGGLSRTTGANQALHKLETNGTFGAVGLIFNGVPSFISFKK